MTTFIEIVGVAFILIGCFLLAMGLGVLVTGALIVLIGLAIESNERRTTDGPMESVPPTSP